MKFHICFQSQIIQSPTIPIKFSNIDSERYPALYAKKIDQIGFFWPLHLQFSFFSIKHWSNFDRLSLLAIIIDPNNYNQLKTP
jgi:hypothetical protein